jgi:DNA-binding NarL/FixJ family response regulator
VLGSFNWHLTCFTVCVSNPSRAATIAEGRLLDRSEIGFRDSLSVEGVPKLIRIVVVDDFAPWREYACSALEKEPQFHIVAAVSDGLEAVQRVPELESDLVTLDVGLPHLNGIEAARRILQLVPQTKILFLSDHSSSDIVREALKTGAKGYVLKSRAQSELLAAAKAVLTGQMFISQILGDRLAQDLSVHSL